MNDDPLEQVPPHVIASARLVCEWFDANTKGDWSLGGLCSRSMVEQGAPRSMSLLEARARAVVAAGRPHGLIAKLNGYTEICPCFQCAAWDELAELLKTP